MTRRSGRPLRGALIGWGAIGKRVTACLQAGRAGDDVVIVIVGIGVRSADRAPDLPSDAVVVTQPGELAAWSLDMVTRPSAGRLSPLVET